MIGAFDSSGSFGVGVRCELEAGEPVVAGVGLWLASSGASALPPEEVGLGSGSCFETIDSDRPAMKSSSIGRIASSMVGPVGTGGPMMPSHPRVEMPWPCQTIVPDGVCQSCNATWIVVHPVRTKVTPRKVIRELLLVL